MQTSSQYYSAKTDHLSFYSYLDAFGCDGDDDDDAGAAKYESSPASYYDVLAAAASRTPDKSNMSLDSRVGPSNKYWQPAYDLPPSKEKSGQSLNFPPLFLSTYHIVLVASFVAVGLALLAD